MPKENNKMQVDIENLIKQNVNDLSAIKELYRKLKEIEKKITQIKNIDTVLTNKLKKDYENLKKDYESLKCIILDENIQAKLANDIETINSQLVTIANNSRIINATFGVAPWWLGDTPEWKIEQDILENKKIGCEEMYLVIHMDYENGKFVTRELIEKQLYALKTCKANGIDVKILKFHTDSGMKNIFSSKKEEFKDYYNNELNRWLTAFKDKGIEYVTVLNEFPSIYKNTEHDDVFESLSTTIKSYGFKVGISTTSVNESLDLTTHNKNTVDAYFMNIYPPMSYKLSNTTLEDCIYSWNIQKAKLQEVKRLGKPMIISETGCQDRWEALANPAAFHWLTSYPNPSNGKAPALMIEGLFKSNIINYFDKVFYWYFDALWFDSVGKAIKRYIGGNQ